MSETYGNDSSIVLLLLLLVLRANECWRVHVCVCYQHSLKGNDFLLQTFHFLASIY